MTFSCYKRVTISAATARHFSVARSPILPKERTMARRILTAIQRMLVDDPTETVHFHTGAEGQPAACYDAACPNPRLDVG